MNQQINITKEQAVQLKNLIERHEEAKAVMAIANKVQNEDAMQRAGIAYENSCMDIWCFQIGLGVYPEMKVLIPDL
jgi:hypothetical protein